MKSNEEVSEKEAEKYAKEINAMFFIISSKTGEGINNMMEMITNKLLDEIKQEEEERIKLENTLVPSSNSFY